jgi:hypothetical protein
MYGLILKDVSVSFRWELRVYEKKNHAANSEERFARKVE